MSSPIRGQAIVFLVVALGVTFTGCGKPGARDVATESTSETLTETSPETLAQETYTDPNQDAMTGQRIFRKRAPKNPQQPDSSSEAPVRPSKKPVVKSVPVKMPEASHKREEVPETKVPETEASDHEDIEDPTTVHEQDDEEAEDSAPISRPVLEKPAEKPVEKKTEPVATPAAAPINTPINTPAATPVTTPVVKPAEKPELKPASPVAPAVTPSATPASNSPRTTQPQSAPHTQPRNQNGQQPQKQTPDAAPRGASRPAVTPPPVKSTPPSPKPSASTSTVNEGEGKNSHAAYDYQTESFEQAIGYYAYDKNSKSGGKLKSARQLPMSGSGYHVYRRSDDQAWGTTDLVTLIMGVAQYFIHEFPQYNEIEVGALSKEKGGLLKGHASHQNGLDADIHYVKVKGANTYDSRGNLDLFKLFVASKRINRIFVSPAIKTQLCQYAKANKLLGDEMVAETLHRLQKLSNHKTHFHLRMTCPEGSKEVCDDQQEPPKGTGC